MELRENAVRSPNHVCQTVVKLMYYVYLECTRVGFRMRSLDVSGTSFVLFLITIVYFDFRFLCTSLRHTTYGST